MCGMINFIVLQGKILRINTFFVFLWINGFEREKNIKRTFYLTYTTGIIKNLCVKWILVALNLVINYFECGKNKIYSSNHYN